MTMKASMIESKRSRDDESSSKTSVASLDYSKVASSKKVKTTSLSRSSYGRLLQLPMAGTPRGSFDGCASFDNGSGSFSSTNIDMFDHDCASIEKAQEAHGSVDGGPPSQRSSAPPPQPAEITPDFAPRQMVEINDASLMMDDTMAPTLPSMREKEKEDEVTLVDTFGVDSGFDDLFPEWEYNQEDPLRTSFNNDQFGTTARSNSSEKTLVKATVGHVTAKVDSTVTMQPIKVIEPTKPTLKSAPQTYTAGKSSTASFKPIATSRMVEKPEDCYTAPSINGKQPQNASDGSGRLNLLSGHVYAQLKDILPLPKDLKPIVSVLLEMESSGVPQETITQACIFVSEAARTVQPGVSGQTIGAMAFEAMATSLGSIDLHGLFIKIANRKKDDLMDVQVEMVFFGEGRNGKESRSPASTPSDFQIAVAYGVFYANDVKEYGFEKFSLNAAFDVMRRMSPEQKAVMWSVVSERCGPRPQTPKK